MASVRLSKGLDYAGAGVSLIPAAGLSVTRRPLRWKMAPFKFRMINIALDVAAGKKYKVRHEETRSWAQRAGGGGGQLARWQRPKTCVTWRRFSRMSISLCGSFSADALLPLVFLTSGTRLCNCIWRLNCWCPCLYWTPLNATTVNACRVTFTFFGFQFRFDSSPFFSAAFIFQFYRRSG